MKIIKRVLTIIVTALLVIIAVYNLYNFIELKVLKKDIATINGYATLEVVSGSMEPTIKIGDMIVINTKGKDYKVDDIITFYDENDSFVTHRIIEINDDKIITQGDANDSKDSPIVKDKIVGKYVKKINGLGFVLKTLKNPVALIMIMVVGVLACIFVSTDKEGNVILTDDEKEFMEFKEYKKNKVKETQTKTNKKK